MFCQGPKPCYTKTADTIFSPQKKSRAITLIIIMINFIHKAPLKIELQGAVQSKRGGRS